MFKVARHTFPVWPLYNFGFISGWLKFFLMVCLFVGLLIFCFVVVLRSLHLMHVFESTGDKYKLH